MQQLYLEIPEYKLTSYRDLPAETPYFREGIPVPIPYEENKPNFERIAQQLVNLLRQYFHGERIALRLLSSSEHQDKSREALTNIIKRTGTDRYDPNRKGDRYDNIQKQAIDFFALDFELGKPEEEVCLEHALRSFYYYPILQGEAPIRVDIGLVYDVRKIRMVPHSYVGREEEIKTDGFVFIDPANKPEALRAILVIS